MDNLKLDMFVLNAQLKLIMDIDNKKLDGLEYLLSTIIMMMDEYGSVTLERKDNV